MKVLSNLEGIIVYYCKNHYTKQAPKDMTVLEGIQRIWVAVCGHDKVYDSSLEYIAKKLSNIVLLMNPDRDSDWLLEQIHETLTKQTFIVDTSEEEPIKRLILLYKSLIAFSTCRDGEEDLYKFPPKHREEMKKILHGEFEYNLYKIF